MRVKRPALIGLQPCPRCRRHVRVEEHRCVFCGVMLDPEVARHAYRTELVQAAFASAVLGAMLACSQPRQNVLPPPPATPDRDGGVHPAPTIDASAADAQEPPDASQPISDAESDSGWLQDAAEARGHAMMQIYSGCMLLIPQVIPFEKSTAKIVGMGFTTIIEISNSLKRSPTVLEIELRAFDDPDDQKTKPWLAAERANKVRKELLALGIAPGRLRISKQVRVVKRGALPGIEFAITKVSKEERCSIEGPR